MPGFHIPLYWNSQSNMDDRVTEKLASQKSLNYSSRFENDDHTAVAVANTPPRASSRTVSVAVPNLQWFPWYLKTGFIRGDSVLTV